MKKTKIVCTIGQPNPKGVKAKCWTRARAMRLNFSHGDYAEHGQRIQNFAQRDEQN